MADTTRLVGRAPQVACLEEEWQRAAGGALRYECRAERRPERLSA